MPLSAPLVEDEKTNFHGPVFLQFSLRINEEKIKGWPGTSLNIKFFSRDQQSFRILIVFTSSAWNRIFFVCS